MKLLPPLPSSPHSRKGLPGHQQRPGLNLPLSSHGNRRDERRKKTRRKPIWGSEGRRKRSGVCLFFKHNCPCLKAAVYVFQAPAAAVCSCSSALKTALFTDSTQTDSRHKGFFLPTQLTVLQDDHSVFQQVINPHTLKLKKRQLFA